MWYLKVSNIQSVVRMWSLPLNLLFQSMVEWKRLSLVVGNRRCKQPTQQSPEPPTTVEQSFQGVGIWWAWCPCQGLTTTPNPAGSMVTEGTQYQPIPHITMIPTQLRALPGHMWYLPQMVSNSGETGWWYGEESYWMKRWQVSPKATSVDIGAPIVQAPQLSESDSPQVQNPLSTNINKGASVLNPPKPTINLVPEKDVPGCDATTSWDPKDYQ